ncbi:hypothetical protein LXA43DRAFT_1143706 [Ganoderma leucocontextum]|nr:hypothetical protein LXA43DRAFT_1143706 [Ganoderma leucocontextum]
MRNSEMSHPAPNSSRKRIPHPILKRDSSPFRSPLPFSRGGGGPELSPHVHFPPTPGMSSMYPAYSPTTYDRKPITISPNIVQLPRRGERKLHPPSPDLEPGEHRGRGRSRSRRKERGGGAAKPDDGPVKGSYFHPRAYEACVPELADDQDPAPPMAFTPPPLIHDLSPSDESDEVVLTPPGAGLPGFNAPVSPRSTLLPLRMPESAKGWRSPAAKPNGADSLPPASLPVVSPQSGSHHARGRRGRDSRRMERREREKVKGTFSPELDEGCLGGF